MQVLLNTSIMRLEDNPLDIGYASEEVTLKDENGNYHPIAGHNGKTQLLISAPFIDNALHNELKDIEAMIPKEEEHEVNVTLIVANDTHQNPHIEGFDFLIDTQGEFADWYGLRLVGDPLGGELTKGIMLISKDGALFHDDPVRCAEAPVHRQSGGSTVCCDCLPVLRPTCNRPLPQARAPACGRRICGENGRGHANPRRGHDRSAGQ